LVERGQGWQGSKMQAYWLVVRVLLTPPAEATASQKWKIIYLQVLLVQYFSGWEIDQIPPEAIWFLLRKQYLSFPRKRESSFSLWTPALGSRKAGSLAGVTSSSFVFRNRYYLIKTFTGFRKQNFHKIV